MTPEEKRKYDKEWYLKNKEKRKLSNKIYYEKNKIERSKKQKEYRRKNIYFVYKWNAKSRNINFLINKEDFEEVIKKPCHYCGCSKDVGIDRIDSKKGYEKNNILPCCGVCNKMKNTFNYDDFINQCKKIINHLKT